MRRNFLSEAQKYIAKNRRRRTWKHIVIALACVVVFCTTYALILPAITVEQQDVNQVVGDAEYQNDTGTSNDGSTEESGTTQELETGEIDFTNCINSVSIQHQGQYEENNWKDVGEDTVKEGDKLRFNIEYVLPGGTLSYENPIITYQLPDKIKVVKESSGKVYDDSGKEIGTYEISSTGKIKITFYEEYVKKNYENKQSINGYIKFDSSVDQIDKNDKGNIELKFNDKNTVEINVEKEVVKTGDIKVEKTASEVKDGKVTYTIVVSSDKGTDAVVDLTDEMSKLAYEGGFKVTNKNSEEVSIDSLNDSNKIPDSGSNNFTLKLPKMDAGDRYTITYTAKFDEVKNGTIYGNNKVTAQSKDSNDNELKSETNVGSTFDNEVIKKWGELSSDKSQIKWTITVNKSKQDISGYTLSDILNGTEFEGDVQITPEGGEASTISLPYTFPEGSNKTYTITYTTSSDRKLGENANVTNKAELKHSNEETSSSEGSVYVDGFNPLQKNAERLNINDDGKTANIKWNVSINTSEGEIPAEWVFTESLQDNQWFTDTQKTYIESIFTGLNSKYPNSINWTEKDVTIDGTTTKKTTGFKVTFTNKLEKGQEINFSYESTGSLGDGSSSITFRNNININDKVSTGGEIQYRPTPVVSKYDLKNNDTNDTSHNYNDINNGILGWGFKVTIPMRAQGQDIVITEKLPEGVSLIEDQGLTENKGLKVLIGDTTNVIEFVDGSATLAVGDYNITFTKNSDNTITINIPKELTQGDNNQLKEYRFEVQAKINSDYDWKKNNYSYSGSFKNEVIVKNKNGDELGRDDQTQTITKDYISDDNVLKKSHGNPTNDSKYENNIIPYSIVINKEGKDLLQGSDEITLKDEVKYYTSNERTLNISLVPGSLHVYESDTNGNKGNELSSDKFKYTFVIDSSEGYGHMTNILSIKVPDEQPLIVEYKYKVNADYNSYFDINNTVSLEGKIDNSYVSNDYIKINITDSSAGANIKGVIVYKVDSDNHAVTLPGAKFKLYGWDNEKKEYVLIKSGSSENESDVFTTDSDGKFVIKDLAYNTAYKLVEDTSPDGYLKDSTPYYFTVGNSDTTTYPLSKPDNFNGIDYAAGSVIYVENKKNSTSITIDKKWFKPDGTEVTGQTGSAISFQLWQIANTEGSGGESGGGTGEGSGGETESDKAKLSIYVAYGWWNEEINIKKGSEVTLSLIMENGEYAGDSICNISFNGDLRTPNITKEGSVKTYAYTFTISEDTNVTGWIGWGTDAFTHDINIVEPTTPSEGSSSGSTEDSGSSSEPTEPTNVGTLYGEYTLDSKEDWTKTITGLPKEGTNESGEKVYYTYYVLEPNYANYDVSYENNEGITNGTIIIKNTMVDNPEYVLPETGRFGGNIVFILGGMLIMAGSLVYIYKRKHKRV